MQKLIFIIFSILILAFAFVPMLKMVDVGVETSFDYFKTDFNKNN